MHPVRLVCSRIPSATRSSGHRKKNVPEYWRRCDTGHGQLRQPEMRYCVCWRDLPPWETPLDETLILTPADGRAIGKRKLDLPTTKRAPTAAPTPTE